MRRATVLLCLSVVAIAVAPGAQAQEASSTDLRVLALSPWIGEDHPFRLRLRVTNLGDEALTSPSVRVSLHPRVITRSALRTALDLGPTTSVISSFEQPLKRAIRPGEARVIRIARPQGIFPSVRGPYPMTIAFNHDGGSESVRTVMPIFSGSDFGAVNVVWVMNVGMPGVPDPSSAAASGTDIAALDLTGMTNRLRAIASRTSGITLAPSAATVDALGGLVEAGVGEAAAALAAMRRAAAASGEVATVPYAPANLPALTAIGPRGDTLRQIAVGRATIERVLGRGPSASSVVAPGSDLDPDSLAVLAGLGATATVTLPDELDSVPTEPAKLEPDKFGVTFPFSLGDGEVAALLPDPDIAERLADDSTGVLLGQAIVAETLGVWQELPVFAPERIVTMVSDPMPDATAIGHLLDAFADAPWVRLLPLSTALDTVAPEGDPIGLAPQPIAPRAYLDAARDARDSLALLSEITVDGIDGQSALDRAVLLAESDAWLAEPDTGVALARRAIARVAELVDGIDIAPRRVTLTARAGDAPLTILNRSPFVLRVRVMLESTKIGFPDGDSRAVELAPGDNTLAFGVEARATGSFPVDVTVSTPDGRGTLATGRLIVRSTAVSAVSLAIVGGSVLFLLAAWFRRALRSDRERARRTGPASARGR